jgi:hypothetical protein
LLPQRFVLLPDLLVVLRPVLLCAVVLRSVVLCAERWLSGLRRGRRSRWSGCAPGGPADASG